MRDPDDTMRVFRYVEQVELEDVEHCGQLRAGRNSCGEGKFVAFTESAAWSWGGWLDKDGYPCCVLVMVAPVDVVESGRHSNPNLDGRGPAAYIEEEDLVRVVIVEKRRKLK